MGAYSQIPVLFVMRGVIIIFTRLSPGSFHYAGRNHHFYSITPRLFFITRGVIIIYSQLSPGSFHYTGRNHQISCVMSRTLI